MTITLNHTIVPARDKDAAARFFAQLFGLNFEGSKGRFAPVRVNETRVSPQADEMLIVAVDNSGLAVPQC